MILLLHSQLNQATVQEPKTLDFFPRQHLRSSSMYFVIIKKSSIDFGWTRLLLLVPLVCANVMGLELRPRPLGIPLVVVLCWILYRFHQFTSMIFLFYCLLSKRLTYIIWWDVEENPLLYKRCKINIR